VYHFYKNSQFFLPAPMKPIEPAPDISRKKPKLIPRALYSVSNTHQIRAVE